MGWQPETTADTQNLLSPGFGQLLGGGTGNFSFADMLDPGHFLHDAGGGAGRDPVTSPRFEVSGGEFGSYSSPHGLDLEHYGWLPQMNEGFANIAGTILGGSRNAKNSIMSQYRDMYRHRAQGIAGAQGEYANRLGGETAAQGLSPELTRRMLLSGNAATQAQIGSEYAGARSGMHGDLAELYKGTATEMAGLQRDELNMLQQAYNNKKGIDSAKGAAQTGAIGSGVGALSSIVGAIFSDRRMKRDVEHVGESPSGIPIYSFRYLVGDDTFIGTMSDDVRHLPGVVGESEGYETVDYSKIDVPFGRI